MAANGRPKDSWRTAAAGAPKTVRGPKGPGARKWIVAAFVVAGIAGAIAGLFVFLKPDPEPVVLVLPITQYKRADWPANPLAESDARAFYGAFPGNQAPAFPDQEKARILAAVQRVTDESATKSKSRPVIVYVNALGIARAGVPYILPGDADPADDSTWLPVEDLVAALRKSSVPRVLILDVRPVSSIRSALATADWNETLLAKLSANSPESGLSILSANNPTDGPTLLRPIRQSAFGLALAQGIGGRADGWNAGKSTNGKVSFREFAQYARQATLIGTQAPGCTPQSPVLIGPSDDFPMISFPEGKPQPMPEAVDAEAYPDWLKASWAERDRGTNAGLHHRAPRIVIQQGVTALRAEEAWFAGGDATANRDRHEPLLKKLAEAGKRFPPTVPPKKSLARWSSSPEADAQVSAATTVLRPYLTKIQSDDAMKKEELQPTLLAVRGALDAKAAEVPPEAVQSAIFATLLGLKTPTHEQIQRASSFIATIPAANRLAEAILVSWIAALPPEQVREWEKASPGTIVSLLLLANATEQALAVDARCLPWLRGELDRLSTVRRKALAVLGSPESGIEDFRVAKAAVDSARRDYDGVRDAAARLTVCFGEIEEGRAVIADLAAAYPHKLAPAPAAVASRWAGLVEHYRRIRTLARPPDTTGLPKLDELADATRSFDMHRAGLIALRIGADDADPKRIGLALGWPWLNSPERDKLLQRYDEASRAVAKRVLDRWPTGPQPDATHAAAAEATKAETRRDLRIGIDFLAMANATGAPKLQANADALGAADERGLADLGVAVRQVARKGLPLQYKGAPSAERAEMAWSIHSDDVSAVPPEGESANPEAAFRKQQDIGLARWLGGHYALEADALRAVTEKACRDAAEELDAIAGVYRNWNP